MIFNFCQMVKYGKKANSIIVPTTKTGKLNVKFTSYY